MNQDNSQRGRHQFSSCSDIDVVSLANVVDVNWNGGVSANSMFFHQGNQIGFGEVVWWTGLFLLKFHVTDVNQVVLAKIGNGFFIGDSLLGHALDVIMGGETSWWQ